MKFTKMQGLGNDYIYINAFEEQIDDPPALARRMSDRHFAWAATGWCSSRRATRRISA